MAIEILNITVEKLNLLLDEKVDKIIHALTSKNKRVEEDEWFDLKGLIEYLPNKPRPQTVYDWVHKKIIPYHKSEQTKALKFLKSEIDQWIKSGRRKTQSEKRILANNYLRSK